MRALAALDRRGERRERPPRPAVAGRGRRALSAGVVTGALALVVGVPGAPAFAAGSGAVRAVAAENEYASVVSQVGGRYVQVSSVMSNPNTDPHAFEASPGVAREVGAAQLVVQNGLGYDAFMNRIESASPRADRKVIDVQTLRGLAGSTPNPHLWYSPQTMPLVAEEVANDLALLRPADAASFQANATRFIDSLTPWYRAIAGLKARFGGAAVAVTEPVGDYLLQAAGLDVLTPYRFQADIMNGTDPAPQDVSLEDGLLSGHRVKVLVYNQQVVDPLTGSFLAEARKAGVPVVGVYETMPTGFTYQSWMLAEVHALRDALARRVSTVKLVRL